MRCSHFLGGLTAGVLALGIINSAHAVTQIPYGTPTVDGNLVANEWPDKDRVRVARFYGTDQFTDFYLQWDDNNLYIAGMVEDYTLKEEGSDAPYKNWDDDSVEVFIHPDITDNATKLGKISRILGFTPTGKSQRLDRGKDDGGTAGLETFKNTTETVGNAFFNKVIPTNWVCPVEQPASIKHQNVVVRYQSGSDANKWWFEMALPWALMGTREGLKITGANCAIGTGVYPTPLAVKDGTALKMNFKRVNDDNGGTQNPVASGIFTNDDDVKSTNGTLFDEWAVYQGDVNTPSEWATFVLRKPASTATPAPSFANTTLQTSVIEGRRVFLNFFAPVNGLNARLPAARYNIRYQEGAVNAATAWDSMSVFTNAYVPKTPGAQQTVEIIGLTPGKTYTVGIRAVDEAGRESTQTLSANVTTTSDTSTFVTTNPTGRTLVTTDGQPFLLLGETVLMPWLPVRGLYNADLCDEYPPVSDSKFAALTADRKCTYTAEDGSLKEGRLRNYATEQFFYTCEFENGNSQVIADVDVTDIKTGAGGDAGQDNCAFVAQQAGTTVKAVVAHEGPQIAVDYMAKLKAGGINVLSVFTESLDLHGSPIMFQDAISGAINNAALEFLDKVIDLAKKNDVRVMIRVYDTYYYKKKWRETYWAQVLGKSSHDGFFDADIYPQHKARLDALFNRTNTITGIKYKDDPTIFGWDLLNEVDNKERFNTASISARRAWLQEMIAHTRANAPHHQVFFSFLTWDPKDDAYYRRTLAEAGFDNFLGMDADLAFRLDGASISAVHGYYAHIAHPQAIPASGAVAGEFQRPLEMARGLAYNYYQVRDGRPVQDTEGAPSPLFINDYAEATGAGEAPFSKTDDKEMFLNSAWMHFVGGGAGANMRWPITLDKTKAATITQIEPTWRTYLTVMKNTVADLAWRGDYMNVDNHRISESLYMFTRHDNSKAVGYFFNPNKQTVNSLIMPGLPAAAATIKIVNPRDGSVIAEQNVANVQSFSLSTPVTDHAVVIASGTFATVNEDAVGGSTPVDQLPVAQLFVSAGFQLQIAQITGLGLNLAVTFNITPDLRFILALDKLTAPVKQYSQPAQLADDFSVTIPVVKMHDDSELNNVVLKLADQTQWIWRLDSIDGQKF